MVKKTSFGVTAISDVVKEMYKEGQTDYFLEPIILKDENKKPIGLIRDGDSVIFCCRRGEREIQLTRTFIDPSFNEFPTKNFKNLKFVTMTLYHDMLKSLPVSVAFPPVLGLKDTLGELVSKKGLKQLRIAESEKISHVTFFLNGCNNKPFPGEDDINIPSPKGVPFDQVPELSSADVAKETINKIKKGNYSFITINFANGDVIGHLHRLDSKIKAAEAVDRCLGQILKVAPLNDYVTLITADHGVLEKHLKSDGSLNVRHTDSLIPFIVVLPDRKINNELKLKGNGVISDIAPTILQIMGIAKSNLMTGKSLLLNYPKTKMDSKTKVILIILDGWGIGKNDETNPIFLANTPVWDELIQKYPFTKLKAAGRAVGLLEGKPGNSEAGHMNMGAGRLVIQDDARIDLAIENGSFHKNTVFIEAIESVKKNKSSLHLIALLSEKSSHGSLVYPLELLRLAKDMSLGKVYVHIIFDGRSTQLGSAPLYLEKFEKEISKISIGKIVSGVGRGIALDRDRNYNKIKKAYDLLVFGVGREAYK